MPINLTEAAAEHIKLTLKKTGHGLGLRLSIALSGCSGYAYRTDIAEAINDDDSVFDSFGAKVIIDNKSLALIDGTTIDFQAQGLNKIYVFKNPQAEAMCGCGESFSIKK